jgi:flagellar biosynthetic protein FlhB
MSTDESAGDKTEEPTERKRQDVRERGSVAKSQDLTTAAGVLAAAAAMSMCGSDVVSNLKELLRNSLSVPAWTDLDLPDVLRIAWTHAGLFVRCTGPWLAIMLVAGVIVNVAQVGLFLTPKSLQPDPQRINPVSGFGRVFSMQGIVRMLAALLKLIVCVLIASGFILSNLPKTLFSVETSVEAAAGLTGELAIALAFRLAIALVVLAVAEYGFQLWKFEQELKMTRQELRDEMRNMEGDPMIRQRRREAHRKLAQAKQLQDVRTADAIVTNPTHYAVAIKYDSKRMAAPIVVAKGVDGVAERIRHVAVQSRVPIIEKPDLARALYRDVKVGYPVPVELYEAVAEILAYVYRLSGRSRKSAG